MTLSTVSSVALLVLGDDCEAGGLTYDIWRWQIEAVDLNNPYFARK